MKLKLLLVLIVLFLNTACVDLGIVDSQADWPARQVRSDVKNYSGEKSKASTAKIKVNQISLSQKVVDERTFAIPPLDKNQRHHIEADFSDISNASNNNLRDVYRVDTRITRADWNILNNQSLKPVFNSNLPIVIVNSLNTTIVDEPAIPAKMDIIKNKQVFKGSIKKAKAKANIVHPPFWQPRNYVTDTPNVYSGNIEIEIRGKSSQGFCKKQYKIETQFGDGSNRNVQLLGMPSENDWILHAPYSDKTLIRNKLVYTIWEQMGWYAPRTRYVELLISKNGLGEVAEDCQNIANSFWLYLLNKKMAGLYEYNGLYLLVEKIKRDANRVNITKLKSSDNTEPAISGGYLLKIDKKDSGDTEGNQYFKSDRDTRIFHVDPKPSKITSVQKTWIKNHINEFEDVLTGVNFADPVNGYRKYIDVESFVDFFLLQEYFKNIDGFRISTYFYKDRNQKIKMGPAWDFNLSSGNAYYCNGASTTGWYKDTQGCGSEIPLWWARLLSDPWFKDQLGNRWTLLRNTTFSEGNLNAIINNNKNYINEAARRNFARWDVLGKYLWPNPVYPATYDEEITNLKNWLSGRLVWIDNNLPLISP